MYCDNELLKLTIDYSFDINSTENKFHRIWKLLDLKPNCTANLKLQDILNLLKEMLEVYRDYDAWKPDINYTMELQDLTDRKI